MSEPKNLVPRTGKVSDLIKFAQQTLDEYGDIDVAMLIDDKHVIIYQLGVQFEEATDKPAYFYLSDRYYDDTLGSSTDVG